MPMLLADYRPSKQPNERTIDWLVLCSTAPMKACCAERRSRTSLLVSRGSGEPSPGADVAGGGPSPGADVARVSPVPVPMWQG